MWKAAARSDVSHSSEIASLRVEVTLLGLGLLACACGVITNVFSSDHAAPDNSQSPIPAPQLQKGRMNCSCADLDSCNSALSQSEAAAAEADGGCSTAELSTADYDQGLHIAAVFIILFASCLGAAIPLLIKRNPNSRLDPFVVILGKCLGTGVVLAAAFIHMLSPASTSLASTCLSKAFQDYPFAFLYAMLAILLMHLLESTAEAMMIASFEADDQAGGGGSLERGDAQKSIASGADPTSAAAQPSAASHSHAHDFGGGHSHSHFLSVLQVKRTIAAYLLEFGVTSHSVIIGIENGIASGEELRALLIALSFHQFFEGVALGARLADANLSHWNEFFLALLFSVSAPIGIAIGIIITSSVNPEGADYLLWQGTFDAVCSGILLYIGAMLLIKVRARADADADGRAHCVVTVLLCLQDFPQDMENHCAKQPRRRAGMFLALYVGAGVMAYIGVYL